MKTKKTNWTYLFLANFSGVLNDNFLKNSIVFLGVTWALPAYMTQSILISLISAALVIPYLLFSSWGGHLAVVYSKQKVFRWCKIAEFPIVLLACIAFWKQSVYVGLLAVLCMGIQSCLYSPSKYGLIRDIGGEKGLSFGSGVFETMAFLGILVGTIIASVLADNYSFGLTALLLTGFATSGYLSARGICVKELTPAKENDSTINPFRFLKASYLYAKKYPCVNYGVAGVAVFWLVGGLIQMNLVIHCKETLHAGNTATGTVMAVAAIGIALGCIFTGRFCNKINGTHILFTGLAGMIVFLTAIIVFNPPIEVCSVFVFFTAFMGGLFEVPCLAMVQKADMGRKLGEILAYMNLVIFIFVLLGSLIFLITTRLSGENSLAVFGVITGICLLTLIYFYLRLPNRRTSGQVDE